MPDECPSDLRLRRATIVVWRRYTFDVRVTPVENWKIFLGTDTHKACAIFFPVHNETNVTASLSERTVGRISLRKKRILTYVQRFPVSSSPVYNERNHAQSSTHTLQTGKWSVFPAQFRHELARTRVSLSGYKVGNHIWNSEKGFVAKRVQYSLFFIFLFLGRESERVKGVILISHQDSCEMLWCLAKGVSAVREQILFCCFFKKCDHEIFASQLSKRFQSFPVQ